MDDSAVATVELTGANKLSKNGNAYVLLTAANRKNRFRLLVFRKQMEKAKKFKSGEEIRFAGKFEEVEDNPGMYTVLVSAIGYADETKQKKSNLTERQNSFVSEEDKARMKARGIVWARVAKGEKDWRKEAECVQIKGHWVDKFYFTLHMLGPELVTKACKEAEIGVMENLKHFTELKQTLFGLAWTDWERGEKPKGAEG